MLPFRAAVADVKIHVVLADGVGHGKSTRLGGAEAASEERKKSVEMITRPVRALDSARRHDKPSALNKCLLASNLTWPTTYQHKGQESVG